MKKQDIYWIVIILSITTIFLIPDTRSIYENMNLQFPYLLGFLKTSILAFMGELLVSRIQNGKYFTGTGHLMKWFVWGLLGMVFVLIFKMYASGVASAQAVGLLPVINSPGFIASLLTAFLISLTMNLSFAPTFMILHRITDGYILHASGKFKQLFSVQLSKVIDGIDWQRFFHVIILKSIPFFWIPAHTITFLLPENYRVLMAAYLSIALGIILSLGKKTIKKDASES